MFSVIDSIVPDVVRDNFWIFAGIMIVILLGLVGLLLYLRTQREEE